LPKHARDDIILVLLEMMKDKDGRELRIGSIVRVSGYDFDEGVVTGFDNGRVDIVELKDGWTLDNKSLEVIGEIGG
jgi:hypothetical protein